MRFAIASLVLAACSGSHPAAPVAMRPAVAAASTVAVTPTPPVPVALWPDLNLGFEQMAGDQPAGWDSHTTYGWSAVGDVHHGGERSLQLRSAGVSRLGVVFATRLADPVRGKHLTLRGWIKPDAPKGSAGMFLRVEGDGGAFRDLGNRALLGTDDWTEVSVELDVPDHAENVVFGLTLFGTGAAWFDDLRLDASELPRGSRVALDGAVVDAGGNPVAGADVALTSLAGTLTHVRSDGAGRFHFDTAPGTWGFSVNHPGHVGSFVDAVAFDHDTNGITLTLAASDGVVVHGKVVPDQLAPGAYAQIGIASEHNADMFAVPVEADGTFEATLPRGRGYTARLVTGGTGAASGAPAGDRVELVIQLAGPPPAEVVDWIGAHAIPLTTTEAGNGFADLGRLAGLVGNARVVGLGEATHGTREFFQLKHRVLEYLVAKLGFTVLAIEADQAECRAINEYVVRGIGDARSALYQLSVWPWKTEEVVAMIEWMRAWNADPKHRRKVQFLGYDMQRTEASYESLAAYLDTIASDGAAALLAPIHALGGRAARTAVLRLTSGERNQLLDGLLAIGAAFEAHRTAWMKQTGAAAFDEARHDVMLLSQATQMYTANPKGGEMAVFNARDRAMAANVQWILEHLPVGARMVVWAHNAHIANRNPGDPTGAWLNMGSHLRKVLKASYVSVGFVFARGSFQARVQKGGPFGTVDEIALGEPADPDVSVAFARTGKSLLALDLRTLPRKGRVHDWFTAPHPLREAGESFVSERGLTYSTVLANLYDAVIFVDHTTRARPLPHVLE